MVGAERVVRRHDQRNARVDARQFFNHDGIFDIAEASAAKLFGEDGAHDAHLPSLLNDFQGENLALVPFQNVRRNLSLGEITDGLFELDLLRRIFEVHIYRSTVSDDGFSLIAAYHLLV